MKRFISFITYGLGILFAVLISTASYAAIPAQIDGKSLPSLAPILKKVMPAVVNVSVQREVNVTAPFAKRPHSPPSLNKQDPNQPHSQKLSSLGSGVVVDAEKGFVLTNSHLINEAKVINVTLNDGNLYPAKVVGSDPASDIAVLQIKAPNLSAMPFGDSDKLHVGDFVAAIGNPFGLNQTVTSGIISALQRSDLHIEGFENFIQTDAAINLGNSGGALIDLNGKLIGINTAILAPGGGNVGIGFAIPSNMARTLMDQLIKYGSVNRGLMGILVQTLTPELAKAFNTTQRNGALVTQVSPKTPAELAGLKVGDIIQKINNQTVKDAFQLRNIIGLLRVGNKVSLQVIRNGKTISITPTIADPKVHTAKLEQQNPFLFGMALENFDEQTPLHGRIKGVVVINASENSHAWRSGIRPGDIIISANQNSIANINELQSASHQNKQQLLLNVLRGYGAMFVVIK